MYYISHVVSFVSLKNFTIFAILTIILRIYFIKDKKRISIHTYIRTYVFFNPCAGGTSTATACQQLHVSTYYIYKVYTCIRVRDDISLI